MLGDTKYIQDVAKAFGISEDDVIKIIANDVENKPIAMSNNKKEKQKNKEVTVSIGGGTENGKSTVARLFAAFCEEHGLEYSLKDDTGSGTFPPLSEIVPSVKENVKVVIKTYEERYVSLASAASYPRGRNGPDSHGNFSTSSGRGEDVQGTSGRQSNLGIPVVLESIRSKYQVPYDPIPEPPSCDPPMDDFEETEIGYRPKSQKSVSPRTVFAQDTF